MFSKTFFNSLKPKNLGSLVNQVTKKSFSDQGYERSLNQINLLGRVGTEPVVKGSDEHPCISFFMATNLLVKSQDELKQKTDWHKITVFKPTLRDSIAHYLKKGHRVFVQGRLTNNLWTDSKGNQQQSPEIIADEVIFLSQPTKSE